ncbi:MAG: CotH kinase family protein [Gemmatimonadaceae bacterium]
MMRYAAALLTASLLLTGCWATPDDPGIVDPSPTPATENVAERLPRLTIATSGAAPVNSKDTYVSATYTLADSTGTTVQQGSVDIKGRGNSTWDLFPKKPYRLKLGNSAALLGMPASKHWVLLANYSDKTLSRNAIVFELSRVLGFEYTPRAKDVDVVLNGDYKGIYQLVEHIRIASDRVNIPVLKTSDTTASAISGGYLMEVDERSGEVFCPHSSLTTMIFCVKEPETLLDPGWEKQRAYLTNYLDQVDHAIFGPDFKDSAKGYAAYIDVASAINYYLANELVRNVDGNLRLSTYLYKKRDGKLYFGPLWDYDLALGNVNYDGADRIEGWQIRSAQWYARLFEDPAFAAQVKARWAQLKSDKLVDHLFAYINERRSYLSKVQTNNFSRWPILETWVWPNRVVTGTYFGEVTAMSDWLFYRNKWMDAQLAN